MFEPSDLFALELVVSVCRMNKQCKIFTACRLNHLIIFASCFLRFQLEVVYIVLWKVT